MSFAIRPEDDFETFHQKNPNIWREFRKAVLDRFNAGIRVINVEEVMKEVTCGTVLKHEIIEKYWKLFISNHQELENVFSMVMYAKSKSNV